MRGVGGVPHVALALLFSLSSGCGPRIAGEITQPQFEDRGDRLTCQSYYFLRTGNPTERPVLVEEQQRAADVPADWYSAGEGGSSLDLPHSMHRVRIDYSASHLRTLKILVASEDLETARTGYFSADLFLGISMTAGFPIPKARIGEQEVDMLLVSCWLHPKEGP